MLEIFSRRIDVATMTLSRNPCYMLIQKFPSFFPFTKFMSFPFSMTQ